MSKINIDSFFRKSFFEHEKNSERYSQFQWKNFEQLLDKELPKRKDNRKGFIFNNMMLFTSTLVIIIILPLLFLHSDNIPVSAVNHKSNLNSLSRLPVSANQNAVIENKKIDETLIPFREYKKSESIYSTIKKQDYKNEISGKIKIENVLASADVEIKNEMNMAIPIKRVTLDYSSTLMAPLIKLKITKNYLKQIDTNNNKKGKIKRSRVLVPNLNYNGF